jgi:hypothetical protein
MSWRSMVDKLGRGTIEGALLMIDSHGVDATRRVEGVVSDLRKIAQDIRNELYKRGNVAAEEEAAQRANPPPGAPGPPGPPPPITLGSGPGLDGNPNPSSAFVAWQAIGRYPGAE